MAPLNQSYSEAPGRHCDRPRYAERSYVAQDTPRRIKRAKVDVAQITPTAVTPAPTVTTAKLDDKLTPTTDTTTASSTATPTTAVATTEISKASTGDTGGTKSTTSTGATTVSSATTLPAVTVDQSKGDQLASTDGKQVCRRYSPTVGGLVDVPCDQ